jgi:predicted unusual protein kinase regulating ubiquinone biosynthesis (AarF/ABC1/UbiB family)
MKSNRKLYRMWKVLSFALSVLIQVYWYRFRKRSDIEKEELWGRIGIQFRQTLFELEGLLIKVGQFLSIRADVLPNGFIKQIEDLVDQVPPSPWEDIKKVLEREWNGRIEDKLVSIEPKVVASASIGEVYRGILQDGTKVAVKVQRPTIQSIVGTDFRSLSIVIWFVHHFAPVPKGFINFKLLYKELKQVIERELDFKKEMETANHFRQRFQSTEGLKIPKMYEELCTSHVLVMEWVDAVRITDTDFLDQHHIDRGGLAQALFRVFIPQWLEAGIFHADPHAGNVLVKLDGTLVLLDFGMVGEISKKDATNFQGLLETILLKNYSQAAEILVELGFLLPDANSKDIESLLAEALSFNIADLKEMDIFAVKKEMNDIVKSLPIQVPTRFIFLGRSFVTIEGILRTVCPTKESLKIMEPAFKDWLNQSNTNKWKLILKWIHSQPVFQIFHSISDLVKTPKQYLELKETQQQREFAFSIYENQKKQVFMLGVLGLLGVFLGAYIKSKLVWEGSAGLICVSLAGYVVCNLRQQKWLNSIRKRRRQGPY